MIDGWMAVAMVGKVLVRVCVLFVCVCVLWLALRAERAGRRRPPPLRRHSARPPPLLPPRAARL